MPEPLAKQLIDDGIVPLAGIETGLAGIQAAVDVGAAWSRAPSPPLLERFEADDREHVQVLDEAAAKNYLADHGVPVPDSRVVGDAMAAAAAAEEIGFSVVAKALGVAHKTEVGGVRLRLTDEKAVTTAVTGMSDLADRFLIERMVEGVVAELIVGVARDPQFGPYLVVGGGGILVELMKDSTPILLPTSREIVLRTLEGLRCAPLFHGFRGSPPADLSAAADAILAIARLVEDDPRSIAELDVNPLMLLAEGHGVVAADALLSLLVRDSDS
jgi:acetyl-CoA synthetase